MEDHTPRDGHSSCAEWQPFERINPSQSCDTAAIGIRCVTIESIFQPLAPILARDPEACASSETLLESRHLAPTWAYSIRARALRASGGSSITRRPMTRIPNSKGASPALPRLLSSGQSLVERLLVGPAFVGALLVGPPLAGLWGCSGEGPEPGANASPSGVPSASGWRN